MEWQWGFVIGECINNICDKLDEKRKKEFIAGVRFLIREDIPLVVIFLYMSKYTDEPGTGSSDMSKHQG